MKIAIFSDTFLPQINGVASVVGQSADMLGKLGHEVWVLTAAPNFRQSNQISSQENFSVIHLPSIPAPVYPGGYRLTMPLRLALTKLKSIKPEVIHTHTPLSSGWEAVFSARSLRVPLVGTHHTFYDYYLKHIKLDYAWAKTLSWKYVVGYYNYCNLVISPTNALAAGLKAHGFAKPVEILVNPVDTNLFSPLSPEKKVELKKRFGISAKSIVYMGRISYEKNIDQLVRAFALLVKKLPETKLMLVGDGPEKTALETLSDELGLKGKVIFTGFLHGQDLADALGINDLFATASKSENMPISILEAEACGLPVVAVDCLGLREIVGYNINGFLVDADSTQQMAEKILEVLDSGEKLQKFSQASRVLAEKHSQERVAPLLLHLYENLSVS